MVRPFALLQLFIFLFFKLSLSQGTDSLVFFPELKFHSEIEKEIFNKIHTANRTDFPLLFVVVSDSISELEVNKIENSVESMISKYRNVKFESASEKKKIKTLYNEVHVSLLKKYEINRYFKDIFSTGEYNCVSGSALYGIILSELNIPYTIKESYNHTYLLTYPESESIKIEPTDPLEGYMYYDDHAKSKFTEFLKNAKLISETEFVEKSTDDLFNEYFFKENDIDLIRLAGLQYYNKSVELIESKKFEECFAMAEKSYYLYPQERTGYMLLISAANILNGCNYSDIKYADYIYKLSRYKKFGITDDNIYDLFINVNQKLLISLYNTDLYDQFYERINLNLNDSILSDRISFVYYYERGRILYNNNKIDKSLVFIERAYEINPKHADVQNLFYTVLLASFELNDSQPEMVLSTMETYAGKFPELMNNEHFNQLRCAITLGMGVDKFNLGENSEALEYINRFENIMNSTEISSGSYYLNEMITEAYSRAASYYYRRGNSKMAETYLKNGLKYAPQSYELKDKLRNL
jgi:tetratricopeptide (TPR) repeat protein